MNRPGDATITTAAGRKNGLLAAVTFFLVSSRAQAPLIAGFLRRVRRRNFRAYLLYLLQYAVVFGSHAAACAIAVRSFGFARGVSVYASALGVPALFALWAIMFTNYLQHVDCDPWSELDHSRNFVSPWMNALLFDSGFHTVHHEHPGMHWSKLRAEHARVAHRIAPRLNENSIIQYCWRVYVADRLRGVEAALLGARSRRSSARATSPQRTPAFRT